MQYLGVRPVLHGYGKFHKCHRNSQHWIQCSAPLVFGLGSRGIELNAGYRFQTSGVGASGICGHVEVWAQRMVQFVANEDGYSWLRGVWEIDRVPVFTHSMQSTQLSNLHKLAHGRDASSASFPNQFPQEKAPSQSMSLGNEIAGPPRSLHQIRCAPHSKSSTTF